MLLTVVIPVYNEAESLSELHAQLTKVASENDYRLQIIMVDDGSSDGSWEQIQRLAEQDPQVEAIRFRRNFGKAAALDAGVKMARGKFLLTMDADLQDDPAEIPRFIEQMGEDDLDVVSGWKKRRLDPWHKTWPSKVFNWLVSWLTKVRLNDHNCGFKCYRPEVFNEVRLYGEMHRFVPVLAAAKGWRVGEIPVHHRPRQHGHSKYGMKRFVKGFLDLLTVYFLTGFARRPQHLLGTLGIFSFLFGLLGLIYLAVYWCLGQAFPDWGVTPLHQRPAVVYSMGLMLLGAQFMSAGFLAELLTAYYGRELQVYSVRERITPGSSEGPSAAADPNFQSREHESLE
ncbi:MAG: glycosyltransferase family 2 protein [Planctomycetales bacterium]|nr:glycosyltransferase family 2 protein [Planctomycetales bacterium]